MPLTPLPTPLICRWRSVTTSFGPAAMKTPLVDAPRMLACSPIPLIVMDFVMVTAPKPPGSSTEISPPAAVFEMAPANVLHGAVLLQGFTSSPTPDTQVRVACADARPVPRSVHTTSASVVRTDCFFICLLKRLPRRVVF